MGSSSTDGRRRASRSAFRILAALLLPLSAAPSRADVASWLPFSTNSLEVVAHADYSLGYWEEMEQSAWVVEELTAAKTAKNFSRSSGFRADSSVSTGSAVSSDYTNSGYDRGHLAPAADFSYDATSMYESFYMSNISPQNPNLNRGPWATLEDWVRARACASPSRTLVVITGPVVTGAVERIGKNSVGVPHAFFKAVLDPQPPMRIAGFLYWNRSGESGDVADHLVTVDEIERLTGLDLFARLQDVDEIVLESSTDIEPWLTDPVPTTGLTIIIR